MSADRQAWTSAPAKECEEHLFWKEVEVTINKQIIVLKIF